jgi:hypothetical protein
MTSAIKYVYKGKSIHKMMVDELYKPQPYYARRLYGKYTIYNEDGAIVAKGLNQKEMENYMKLLKEE